MSRDRWARFEGRMGELPILAMCTDPIETRRRAAVGRPTPCYRCLAWRNAGDAGCFFVARLMGPTNVLDIRTRERVD